MVVDSNTMISEFDRDITLPSQEIRSRNCQNFTAKKIALALIRMNITTQRRSQRADPLSDQRWAVLVNPASRHFRYGRRGRARPRPSHAPI
jgi:hypothetical protein